MLLDTIDYKNLRKLV